MARRRKRNLLEYIQLPSLDLDQETKRGIFIVFIFALGAISLLGLFGMAGMLGVKLTEWLTLGFGWGKWLVPLALLVWGYALYEEDKYEIGKKNYFGAIIFIFSFQALLMLCVDNMKWEAVLISGDGGGYVGWLLANILLKYTGLLVSFIISIALIIASLSLLFNTTPKGLLGPESFFSKLLFPVRYVFSKLFGLRNRDEEEGEDEEEEQGEDEEEPEEEEEEDNDDDEEGDEEEGDEEEPEEEEEGDDEDKDEDEVDEDEGIFKKKTLKDEEPEVWWKPTGIEINLPLNLLDSTRGKPTSGDIKENQEIIRKTLFNFGIPVEMGAVSVGPTVTQYTLRPAEGIKLSKITNLSNDLALALAMHPIRIEAPIPGKSLVGVEVPNQSKAVVGLKEVLSVDDFKNRKSNLMIALGKDVAGKSWVDNIAKMPHMLVAGATNSGKSVCLNAIIISLLYENNPDDLRFIMVDPKRVELIPYNGIPHLLTPVITDVAQTINALKWCLNEMDRRFDILSASGKKDIKGYNETVKLKMPYIVFIIDELADLMVAAGRDIEAGVIRLSQMARAVGIHLILATQRPSVDIITGVIKANMPTRIAFSVASSTDSRTILDTMGAEKLLGRGDMLFQNAEMSKPKRLQGAFVSENEIKRIVRYVKDKSDRKTLYLENVTGKQKVKGIGGYGMNGGGGDDDELFEEAKATVISANKASTSFLQRKLSIGYSRAAKLLDSLEEAGVVGPANGAKPREILVSQSQYASLGAMGVSGMPLHRRQEASKPEEFLDDEDEDDIPPIFKDEPESSFAKATEDEEDEVDDEDGENNEETEDDEDENADDDTDGDESEDNDEDEKDSEDEEDNESEESSFAKATEDKDEVEAIKESQPKKKEPKDVKFNKFFSR